MYNMHTAYIYVQQKLYYLFRIRLDFILTLYIEYYLKIISNNKCNNGNFPSDITLQLPYQIMYLSSPSLSELIHFNININTNTNITIKLTININNNNYYYYANIYIYNDIHTKDIVHTIVKIITMYLLLTIATNIIKSQSPFQSVEMRH